MPNYRRAYQPGGCWFFTTNLAVRGNRTLVEHIGLLMATIRRVKHQRPFRLDALVVLPDHVHFFCSPFSSSLFTIAVPPTVGR